MAITWRQHIKNTMARMGKKTHLKDVLKEASKTWKSVKKNVSEAVAPKSRRARKGSRKHNKTHRHTKRSRRGGAVVAASAEDLQGGLKAGNVTGSN